MKKLVPFLLVVLFLAIQVDALGQCAMCKAVAESDLEGGGTAANGLNTGILYLMGFPYLLLSAVGLFWYRHNKRLKQNP